MPPPPRRSRRDEPEDPGYEVVDDPPPRKRMARVLGSAPAEDPGYEVVDEAAPQPVARKKRPVVAVDDEDDADETVSNRRTDETTDATRKKKTRRKRPQFDEDLPAPRGVAWWVTPVVLICVGLAFCLVGSLGSAAKAKNAAQAMSTGVVLTVTIVQVVISIPLSIFALILGGKAFGIEYGSPMMAIAHIAAIGMITLGLEWILTWIGLWGIFVSVITLVVGFSLFMSLFELDTWEAIVSIICINAVSFLAYLVAFVVLVAFVMRSGGGGNDNFDDFDPNDGEPKVKQKQTRDTKGAPPANRGGVDPDDDN